MLRRTFLTVAAMTVLAAASLPVPSLAAGPALPKPGAKDLCPVCGMLVSKYPNWIAIVTYKDGHAHFFDGAKDMFKYLADVPK